MTLIRWNPASDLVNLHSEMDRLFSQLTEGLTTRSRSDGDGREESPAFLPVDIERSDDALLIRASVPGFRPEDVEVTVDNGVLTIDARHTQEDERREGRFLRRERFVGRLYRQIALGEGLRAEEAQASFENGVLTIRIPMAERPEPRKIPVQGSGDGEAQAHLQGQASTPSQAESGSGQQQQQTTGSRS
jgi:HSP20 family protein